MEAKSKVRLVIAHAECRSGDDGLEFIFPQLLFNVQAVGCFRLAGVSWNIKAALTEIARQTLGFSNGERVDDA